VVSGAPSRLAVSTTAASPCEDTCQAGTIAYEDGADNTARKRLKTAPAASLPPSEDVAAGVCSSAASSGHAPDAPTALPAGVTVRRRRRNNPSTAASADEAVPIDPAPAPVNSLRRVGHAHECPVLSSPARVPSFGMQPEHHRHSTAGMTNHTASGTTARAARRASIAARPPSARLQLQMPAPARRASLVPTAAKQPAALPARSRQSISYFHRECVCLRGCLLTVSVVSRVLQTRKGSGP